MPDQRITDSSYEVSLEDAERADFSSPKGTAYVQDGQFHEPFSNVAARLSLAQDFQFTTQYEKVTDFELSLDELDGSFANDEYTIGTPGVYFISAQLTGNVLPQGEDLSLQIMVNGFARTRGRATSGASQYPIARASSPVKVSSGDIISLEAKGSVSGSTTANSINSQLSIIRLDNL